MSNFDQLLFDYGWTIEDGHPYSNYMRAGDRLNFQAGHLIHGWRGSKREYMFVTGPKTVKGIPVIFSDMSVGYFNANGRAFGHWKI